MEKLGKYLFMIWVLASLLWLYFNQSAQSIVFLVIISIIFYIVYQKQIKPIYVRKNKDPYKASYEVEEIHNDFSKVGSGYPIKKHQKITCCRPVVDCDKSGCEGD